MVLNMKMYIDNFSYLLYIKRKPHKTTPLSEAHTETS